MSRRAALPVPLELGVAVAHFDQWNMLCPSVESADPYGQSPVPAPASMGMCHGRAVTAYFLSHPRGVALQSGFPI